MSLVFVFGVWLLIGGFVYRVHINDPSAREPRNAHEDSIAVSGGDIHNEIPDTVPSEWIEAYRTEHGG